MKQIEVNTSYKKEDFLSIFDKFNIEEEIETDNYIEYETIVLSFSNLRVIQSIANEFVYIKETEYKDIEAVFEHKIQDYLYDKGFSPRRIMYNNFECITAIHLLPLQLKTLRMNVFMRSSNIEKLLYNDLAFICKLYMKCLNKLNHLKPKYINFKIEVVISCPHRFPCKDYQVEFRENK